MEQTIKCRICGKPYAFYDMYAGDQSACPACRRTARRNLRFVPADLRTLDAENHARDLRVEHDDGSWRDREAPRE